MLKIQDVVKSIRSKIGPLKNCGKDLFIVSCTIHVSIKLNRQIKRAQDRIRKV